MKGLKIIASVLLLAVICTASESGEDISDELVKYDNECREEVKLPKDVEGIKKICAEADVDRNSSCYMACIHKKIGTLKDGEVIVDRVKEFFLPLINDESVRNELLGKLDTCKAQTSTASDDCDKITGFARCMIKETDFCKRVRESK